jgi:hypothetical protein
MPKSKKSQKNQNWFSRLFSGDTKNNNIPLSKKKDIAKKWCKNQKYRGSPPGRCNVHQDLCVCEDDGWEAPINNRFKWKFGFNSIKYNKSSKCKVNKKTFRKKKSTFCAPKINYKKMKV